MAEQPGGNPEGKLFGPVAPAVDAKPVTKGGSSLPFGPPRSLWIGEAGTINLVTEEGTVLTDFPAKEGLLPIKVISVLAGGTATDIWALY